MSLQFPRSELPSESPELAEVMICKRCVKGIILTLLERIQFVFMVSTWGIFLPRPTANAPVTFDLPLAAR